MEAITLAGLAVLAVGGYYSLIDFMSDLGICWKKSTFEAKRSDISRHYILSPQTGIK